MKEVDGVLVAKADVRAGEVAFNGRRQRKAVI